MYTPNQTILKNYANVLINFALNSGEGVKKGETVVVRCDEYAKPLLREIYKTILQAGAHPIIQFTPDQMQKEFYDNASEEQINFFPEKYIRGLVDQMDHTVVIIAETDKKELVNVPPTKILSRQKAFKPYMDWRNEKEGRGEFTWTLGLYGTPAMADEAGLTLEEYWEQIIHACFLDADDPVQKWKETTAEVERVKETLNELKIQSLHVEAEDTDLIVGLGDDRQWMGGSGRNIPSFEVFISPDWRKTQGHIQFTEPLYRHGNLVKRARLEFKDGLVTQATAEEGEEFLKELVAQENANKIGEYSLTDARLSRITKFMAETLFDENVGGKYGNTHLAVGMAYKDSFPGDIPSVTKEQWDKMGYNESAVHTDIVATSNRTVTATLKDGSTKVIYKDGQFQV